MTFAVNLVIRAEAMPELERALDDMLQRSQAECALLISRDDGSLITARGFVRSLDTTSLAALAAGTFASAREIAHLIGEPEFSVLFHQGRREHVHVNLAGPHGLLMTLFDDTTTVGLVRLSARRACAAVQRALSAEESE
jgi:predicted regulator of Ras-like GTPase activity (Roadblock/LC7/MglB family)